jgi:hypothetical protein
MKKGLLIFILLALVLQSCSSDRENAIAEYEAKYDCGGIDDCLSRYNFEGARAFVNLIDPNNSGFSDIAKYSEGWEKIVNQESDFWFNDGNYEKAISIIKDEKLKFHHSGGTMFNEKSYHLALYKLIGSVIDKLLFENKIEDAKKWCFRLPDATTDGWGPGSTSQFDIEPKMREVMMTKIKEFEKISK